ncbi:MAG: hypothetical protein KDE31_15900 [Caldilineaceae bacterium]|nr:hypothetical protein [Caldilineaceae bacterium]
MINNLDRFIQGLWNWDPISEVLPGKARVGDIDGCLERRGKLLMLETKAPGAAIPTGQAIMFDNLRKTGVVSTIIIWGRQNQPEAMEIYAQNQICPKRPATMDDVRAAVRQWYTWASQQPRPEQRTHSPLL